MKTLKISTFFRISAILAVISLGDFTSPAQTASGFFFPTFIEVENIRDEGVGKHPIKVHYPYGVNKESLDDFDVWVISHN